MKPSKYNGRKVIYVDPADLVHEGKVVGQSNDGRWIYVQAARYESEPDDWHFQVRDTLINGMLTD